MKLKGEKDHGKYEFRKKTALATVSLLTIAAVMSLPARAADPNNFDIAGGPLSKALLTYSRQSNTTVVAPDALISNKLVTAVNGDMDSEEALRQLLSGSGLAFRRGKGGGIIIFEGSASNSGFQKISYNTMADFEADLGVYEEDEKQDEIEELEEVVVTGSHIRGAGPVGSQVFTYDREEIDRKGYSTIPEFIQSLPQNFNGGVSESTSELSLANGPDGNFSDATGINLRGLGNVSTLVLLNGQRLAPVGLNGNVVDISMIPLSAIERVEVLTDGASAVYGSDAIGGVVNFKMRKDYDGAETRVRYGGATQGGLGEILVGQTFGKVWDKGHGLISYEYNHRNALDAKDRSFTKDAPVPNDLLPKQERQSFFLNGGQNLTESLEIFTTAYYNKRDSERNQFLAPGGNNDFLFNRETKQYGGTLGSAMDLDDIVGNDWRVELIGSYSHSEFIHKQRLQDQSESDSRFTARKSEILSVDATFDGSLFSMAGGEAKLAIGGHFRHETFGNLKLSVDPSAIQSLTNDSSRNITALFGEIYLPFVGKDNRMPGVERLEISISGRYEHYSDFGSSTDPKIGALWSPVEGLNIRGTYGTSYRAPLLTELDEGGNIALLVNGISNLISGKNLVLVLVGAGNKNLQPETATLWTAGFDLQPPALPGLSVNVNYFNIDFSNKTARPIFAIPTILTDPKNTSFIDLNGPDTALFSRIEDYRQLNFTSVFGPPADFADAEVVFNGLFTNLSRNKVTGLDFSTSYGFDSDNAGSWNFSLNGTYLFDFIKQTTKSDPSFDVVGTINNPAKLRMNSSVSWGYEGFTTNLTVNYVDSYLDDRTATDVPVSSWTTTNLTISYNTEDRFEGFLKDTVFTLSAVNLFDQDPPFLKSLRLNANINYDPSAASPAGRVLSFQITKKW